jgi:hypothetical protein
VKGSKKAEGWRDFVVEMEDCTLQAVENTTPPKKDSPPVVELPMHDPSFEPWNEKAYNEKVIIRFLDGEKFLTPMKNVPAHRRLFQGQLIIDVIPGPCADLPKGSEIIDKDGIVFGVVLATPNDSSIYQSTHVTPKKKLSQEDLAAIADQAKEDPPKLRPWNPQYTLSYDEKVTVRQWYGQKFLNPVSNVSAHRGQIEGKLVIYTRPRAGNDKTPKGSEITDKDGNVYVVDSVAGGQLSTFHINYVTPKKKP